MAYNNSIPQPTNLISNSQSQLLANFGAIDSGTTQTGIGFSRNHVTMTDATNGGLHNRIDFYQNIANPTIIDWVSSAFPKAGTASNTTSQLFYANTNAVYHLSPIKAWGLSAGTMAGTGILAGQSSNVTSVTRVSTGNYNVVMPANTCGNNTYAVIITSAFPVASTDCVATNYTVTSATTFNIKTVDPISNSVIDVNSFSFMVLQI